MNKSEVVLFLFLIGALMGCEKIDYNATPPAFNEYLDEFVLEASKRGLEIDLEQHELLIEFSNLRNEDRVGYCNIRKRIIVIDSNYWKNANEHERKILLFHELGHCLLDRHHHNDFLYGDICSSLMAGDEDGFECALIQGSDLWWNYYLDELFDVSISADSELIRVISTNAAYFSLTDNFAFNLDTIAEKITLIDIPIPQSDTIVFEVIFTPNQSVSRIYGIEVFDFLYNFCFCENGSIRIKQKSTNDVIYDSGVFYELDGDIKLSIIRTNKFFRFYINDSFLFIVEDQYDDVFSDVAINRFSEPVEMELYMAFSE